jgi:hypothetical protein
MFQILANLKKKKDAAMAIQHALDDRAWMPGDSTRVSPVVTPELIEHIYAFKAGTHDVDDLPSGFSLFLFVTGSPEATTQARARLSSIASFTGGLLLPPWIKSGRSFPEPPRRGWHSLSPPWNTVIRATALSWM